MATLYGIWIIKESWEQYIYVGIAQLVSIYNNHGSVNTFWIDNKRVLKNTSV